MAYQSRTCPTCGAVKVDVLCDNCRNVIPDGDLSTIAVTVTPPGGGDARYLCGSCKTLPIVTATLGS